MSDEFWRALIDPSAPLPHNWPVGALGAFLLFCVPIGGGVPAGGLLGGNAGLSPPAVGVVYFFFHIVVAVFLVTVLLVFPWLGVWDIPPARVGDLDPVGRPAGRGRSAGCAWPPGTRPGGVRCRSDDRPRGGRGGGARVRARLGDRDHGGHALLRGADDLDALAPGHSGRRAPHD